MKVTNNELLSTHFSKASHATSNSRLSQNLNSSPSSHKSIQSLGASDQTSSINDLPDLAQSENPVKRAKTRNKNNIFKNLKSRFCGSPIGSNHSSQPTTAMLTDSPKPAFALRQPMMDFKEAGTSQSSGSEQTAARNRTTLSELMAIHEATNHTTSAHQNAPPGAELSRQNSDTSIYYDAQPSFSELPDIDSNSLTSSNLSSPSSSRYFTPPTSPSRSGESSPINISDRQTSNIEITEISPSESPRNPPVNNEITEIPIDQGTINRLSLSVKDNGRLSIEKADQPEYAAVLEATLGRKTLKYSKIESNTDNTRHLLQDNLGRQFQIEQQPFGLVACHTNTKDIPLTRNHPELTADSAILSRLTDTYTGISGEIRRVNDNKLYTFDKSTNQWDLADDGQYNKLNTMPSGESLVIKDEKIIHNLDRKTDIVHSGKDIEAYATTNENLFLLAKNTEDDAQEISVHTLNASPNENSYTAQPGYADGQRHLDVLPTDKLAITSLCACGQTLYALDDQHRLLSSATPSPEHPSIDFRVIQLPELEKRFGKGAAIEELSNTSQGQPLLIIKDSGKHLQALTLNGDNATEAAWNLSDVLRLDYKNGLKTNENLDKKAMDIVYRGSLSMTDSGEIYYKDKLSHNWVNSGEKADALQKGLDGNAYCLKDGEVKKIDFSESNDTFRFGQDNIFALHKNPSVPSAGSELKGITEGQKVLTFAPISERTFVAETDDGKVNLYQTRANDSIRKTAIPMPELSTKIQQLELDKDRNLYALTDDKRLFQLPKDVSIKNISNPADAWKEITLPIEAANAETVSMGKSMAGRLFLDTGQSHKTLLYKDGWKIQAGDVPELLPPASPTHEEVFDKIIDKKFKLLGKTGISVSSTMTLGNVTDIGNHKIGSSFGARLRAHVFSPSSDFPIPRPLKTLASSAIHSWQGREGLKPIYEQENKLYKSMAEIIKNPKAAPQADLQSRLEKLDLGESGKSLVKEISSFIDELESSADTFLSILGKSQGVLDSQNHLNLDYKPSKLKNTIQSMNVDRSGKNLSKELFSLWKQAPSKPDSNVGQLLSAFTQLNLNMSHSKDGIPLNRQRNVSDNFALAKARVVLDLLMQTELDSLLNKLEQPGNVQSEQSIAESKREFDNIRDTLYDGNKIKHYTDIGMLNFKELEAAYDISKSFINAFKQKDNGVKMMTQSVFNEKDPEKLADNIKHVINTMGEEDEFTLTRSYTMGVGTSFLPDQMDALLNFFPSAKLAMERNYSITFAAETDNILVNMYRNLGPSAEIGLGHRTNLHSAPNAEASQNSDGIGEDKSKERKWQASFMAGVSGAAVNLGHEEFEFLLSKEDTGNFIEGLTKGEMNPEEILSNSYRQRLILGNKTSTNVTAGGKLYVRGQVNPKAINPKAYFESEDSKVESRAFRLAAGVKTSVDLAHYKEDNLRYRGKDYDRHRVNVKQGFLNKASAGGELAATMALSIPVPEGTIYESAGVEASAAIKIDNSTKRRAEITTKTAKPLTDKDVEGLIKTLNKAFKNEENKQFLSGVKALEDPIEQLNILHKKFVEQEVTPANDDQYLAIREIKSKQLQHEAAEQHGNLISGNRIVMMHYNIQNLDHATFLSTLASYVSPVRQSALAEKIQEMSKHDPVLKDLLELVRTEPNCYTYVTINLTDEAEDKLNQALKEGKADIHLINKLYDDPNNRRLKSIAIWQAATHEEGVTPPMPFAKAKSSNTIEMQRTIGTIKFKYGEDQHFPNSYQLTGKLAKASDLDPLVKATKELGKQGVHIS